MSVYAVADLHGQLELWKAIERFLKPEDKIYVLGDCGDRGPQPWETIKAVFTNPQVEYLLGNHELMLTAAMSEWLMDEQLASDYYLLCSNGGLGTFDGWLNDGAKTNWCHELSLLPSIATYINKDGIIISMSHSGKYISTSDDSYTWKDLVWDREHFNEPWCGAENEVVVHGHTPIPHLAKKISRKVPEEPGAFWYCDNHKICLDNASFSTGFATVLDLDTFDEHVFVLDKSEENDA